VESEFTTYPDQSRLLKLWAGGLMKNLMNKLVSRSEAAENIIIHITMRNRVLVLLRGRLVSNATTGL